MARLTFTDFKGEIPKLHPRLLPAGFAQAAANTRLDTGAISPSRDSATVLSLGIPAASIYLTGDGEWLSWADQVDAVPGPVAAARTYFTGDGAPKVKFAVGGAGTILPLALPRPTAALTATPAGTADPATSAATLFSYTFVTSLDEESQPAALSNEVVIDATQDITLTGYPDAAAIAALGRSVNRLRFYKSQTDSLGATSLFLVQEVLVSALGPSWVYTPASMPIGETCPSADYDPPDATLAGITGAPGGIMVAFTGRDLYFSEPWRPHAWPIKYSLTTDFPIVGVASVGSSIAIMTEGTPYIAQGFDPSQMALSRIEQNLPCVSALGIVDLGYAVAYPSMDGLVVITNGGANIVTQSLFTATQWRDLNPASIVAGQYQGRYVFSYLPTGATDRQTVLIDLSGAQPFLIRADETFTAVHFEIGTGKLFTLRDGDQVRQWDAPSADLLAARWRSALNWLPSPTNFGAYLIETDGTGTLTARFYADGVLRLSTNLQNRAGRLPSGFNATRWEVEVEGTATISAIKLAHSPMEFNE